MVRHNHLGFVGNFQALRTHFNALPLERVHFLAEHGRVHDHAVADKADLARVQNARGNQVQDIFFTAHNDGVPGVVAALETDNVLGLGGQKVHQLAFAFVAPLRPHNDHI